MENNLQKTENSEIQVNHRGIRVKSSVYPNNWRPDKIDTEVFNEIGNNIYDTLQTIHKTNTKQDV